MPHTDGEATLAGVGHRRKLGPANLEQRAHHLGVSPPNRVEEVRHHAPGSAARLRRPRKQWHQNPHVLCFPEPHSTPHRVRELGAGASGAARAPEEAQCTFKHALEAAIEQPDPHQLREAEPPRELGIVRKQHIPRFLADPTGCPAGHGVRKLRVPVLTRELGIVRKQHITRFLPDPTGCPVGHGVPKLRVPVLAEAEAAFVRVTGLPVHHRLPVHHGLPVDHGLPVHHRLPVDHGLPGDRIDHPRGDPLMMSGNSKSDALYRAKPIRIRLQQSRNSNKSESICCKLLETCQ